MQQNVLVEQHPHYPSRRAMTPVTSIAAPLTDRQRRLAFPEQSQSTPLTAGSRTAQGGPHQCGKGGVWRSMPLAAAATGRHRLLSVAEVLAMSKFG